ncbi:hypothetical protein [Nocardioides sp.]|uniref:hypothetical protein n=1 Tax=Nocardioides sp. TaxID=35761 RepID=UPI002D7EB99F|nr:hypothetical protein [Nocardioides sp.]
MRLVPLGFLLALSITVGGCGGDQEPGTDEPTPPEAAGSPTGAASSDSATADAEPDGALGQVLRFVPDGAEVATVTDFDRFRARLGVPGMTSDDPMTDRFRFWERAPAAGVMLQEGRLREENSTFELDFGFTQDDVDWEMAFTGDTGSGFALGFRPDLDMDRVQGAIGAGIEPLTEATVLADDHVVVSGDIAASAAESWADEPWAAAVAAQPADSYYLRGGDDACIPLEETLGVDATVEDQQAVLDQAEVRGLADFDAFAMAFTSGSTAFALLAYATVPEQDEVDLRSELDDAWPRTSASSVVWADAFESNDPLPVDEERAVVPLTVTNPRAASAVVLGDALPLAVCGDVRLLPEPTGL